MSEVSYAATFTVDASPDAVYAAINNVRGWWTGEIEGSTDRVGDVFTYRYEQIHRSTQEITELSPGKRVVWHVVDGYLDLVADKREWTGTDIVFDIERKGDETEVRFTHVGLVPAFECFDKCSDAWGFYVRSSLPELIATGGRP